MVVINPLGNSNSGVKLVNYVLQDGLSDVGFHRMAVSRVGLLMRALSCARIKGDVWVREMRVDTVAGFPFYWRSST